jgi:phage-related protein
LKLITYCTSGGKNLIFEYLDMLPTNESAEGYAILTRINSDGYDALDSFDTRQIKGKLWEIKFRRHNRLFYCIIDEGMASILHACKKQKGKAEKYEIDTAEKRMKEIL